MVLPPQVFQFHDIAAVKVQSDSPFARAFFEAEYGFHHVDRLPDGFPCVLVDFRLASSTPDGFTRHTHKLLARWSYRLTINQNNVDIRVSGNRAAVSMIHHMLVHPSLRWLASGRGTLMLHAGAVVKNGKSLILTGKGGAGKTTLTSLILASGGLLNGLPFQNEWQLHADDYVFLSGSQSKAYITRSHLYRDLLNWIPEIGKRLTPRERIRLEFLGAIRKYSREQLKWAVRLGHERLWPGKPIANTAIPAAILLLGRAEIPAPKLVPVDDLRAVVSELLEMNFGEARHFLRLIQKTGTFDEGWQAAWKSMECSLLTKFLAETPAYRLILPISQSSDEVNATLLPILENLVKV